MMKNRSCLFLGIALTALTLLCVGFRLEEQGIKVANGFGGEPCFWGDNAAQTADWIQFSSSGAKIFGVPSTGIIPVQYGGTGVATLAELQALVTNAPNNGVVAVANGGTGTNTLALISWPTNLSAQAYFKGAITALAPITNKSTVYIPTNTASFTTVTNDLVTGAWNLMRAQRGSVTVSLVATTPAGGIGYSNSVSGQTRTFPSPLSMTNTLTIRFQPGSLICVTNATVLDNTTSIVYE